MTALAVLAAALIGPAAVVAESAERAYGRVILTVQGVEGVGDEGPPDPIRYEVDAVLSSESSRYGAGVVIRWDLPQVVTDHLGVATLDLNLDALLVARTLPLEGPWAILTYRELAPGGLATFEGVAVDGDVALLSLGPRDRGLALHVAFGARIVDPVTGAERLFTDGEAATLPREAAHPETVVTWREEAPPDVVYLESIYVTSDCTGDPLYEPGFEVAPGAWPEEPAWDDGAYDDGWGGYDDGTIDYGYGSDHVGVDPGDGSVDGGDGWDGWDPDDDWSDDGWGDDGWGGGDGVNDGGGDGWGDDGWDGGDGVNDDGWDDWDDVDAPDEDSGDWDSSDWSDDDGWDSGWDSGDPGGGCGAEDDPGYEDDTMDCGGADPGDSGDEGVDMSCDGSDTSDGSSADPLDCDVEASSTASGAAGRAKRPRRWRGWNLSPILLLLGWWAWLRFRRGRPLPSRA